MANSRLNRPAQLSIVMDLATFSQSGLPASGCADSLSHETRASEVRRSAIDVEHCGGKRRQDADIATLSSALSRYTLSRDQLQAIASIIAPDAGRHGLDFKASVPLLPGKRFYVRLLPGTERRSAARLDREGQTKLHRVALVHGAIVLLFFGYAVFGAFCFAYLLKSALHINLFNGQSPFHDLYVLFFR